MIEGSRKTKTAQLAAVITKWLSSEWCFYAIIVLLAIQALWFVVTARYPMAFDENFHFGLIQLHAQQWLPFFTAQPPHASQFGAIARDPSYLYHYLMSFPYRLTTLISHNTVFQIIVLRLINVGLSLYTLILARQLLRKLKASRALTHASLLLFVLVPIVPFLAATINYDNLFVPLVLWSLLATFAWVDALKANRLSLPRTVFMLSVFGLACLVKYAFLPIAAMLGGIMLWEFVKQRGEWHLLRSNMVAHLRRTSRWPLAAGILLLILSAGLFSERYAINLYHYHSPDPDCGQVLTVSDCLSYGPWARDYTLKQTKPTGQQPNKLAYLWQWPFGIWFRSFFAISDTYDTQLPLPIPGGAAIAVAGVGIVIFVYYSRRLLRQNTNRRIVLLAFGLYTLALSLQTFQSYLATGEPVAINGRYILPFLPAVILLAGLAYRELWKRQANAKAFAVTLVVLLFLPGGTLTFIMRSTDEWFWPNTTVTNINHSIREALEPLIIGSGHYQ